MTTQTSSALITKLAELEAIRESSPAAEKRQFPRLGARGEGLLVAARESRGQLENVHIQLRDISWGGIGFIGQESLEVGSQWQSYILRDGHQINCGRLTIRHCSEVSEGVYLCGSSPTLEAGMLALVGVNLKRV